MTSDPTYERTIAALFTDYARNPSLMPAIRSVVLHLAPRDADWNADITFGKGGPGVTCRLSVDDLAQAFRGQASEVVLLAEGNLTIEGGTEAISAFLGVLGEFGARLAVDLDLAGHRFTAVGESGTLPSEIPGVIGPGRSDQRWVAALIIARLVPNCQRAQLERILPAASKLGYPGVERPDDMLARTYACAAGDGTSAAQRWGATANRSVVDPDSLWRIWADETLSATHPLGAAFDRLTALLDRSAHQETTP